MSYPGIPDDATIIDVAENPQVPDPVAYRQQYVDSTQASIDHTNGLILQSWQGACATWYQAAMDARSRGNVIPPKPMQPLTIALHTLLLDRGPQLNPILGLWQRLDGPPAGDPCPDLPPVPGPNTPHIGALVYGNMYQALEGDTVFPGSVITVLPAGVAITGPLQVNTDGSQPAGKYVKVPGMLGMGRGYYQFLSA